ncbi:unnamed protein product [Blepharisma stoltei]|uniref:Uncharacterized protein n=1 Tax=Blepharisma stoltei TaxID=1481888 RepID=A0AAU9IPF4_9CILI|nr:unnamed protein product [Blepharisma stoltei]
MADFCRLDQASYISRFLMLWIFPTIRKLSKTDCYYDKNLEILPKSLETEENFKKLKGTWTLEACSRNPSFIRALFKAFGWRFFTGSIPFILTQYLSITIAILINLIIGYFEDDSESQWKPILYSLLLLFVSLLYFIQNERGYFDFMLVGVSIESSIYGLAYEKVLNMPYKSLSQPEISGQILSIISTDNEGFRMISLAAPVWTVPIYLIGAAVALYIYLGWPGLVGLFLIICTVPLQIFLSKKNIGLRNKISQYIDSRVNLIGNILDGIRIIKFYTWEISFSKIVGKLRESEISFYFQSAVLKLIINAILISGQGLIIVATFWIYVETGGVLKLSNVFCGVSILMTAHFSVSGIFANGLLYFSNLFSTSRRIGQFLLSSSINFQQLSPADITGELELIDVIASWNKVQLEEKELTTSGSLLTCPETPAIVLRGISFKVAKGELCALIGAIGSGKSTIAKTILEETSLISGEIKIKGSIAYLEQQPWIMSGTIKENIIMGDGYDQNYYEDVLKCCCLKEDISEMKHGDYTQVGVKGCNLSGGQRARIALARAAYAQRDIYLLDDPFSSVDSKVAEMLFSNCVNGLLKEKTRILITNQQEFLPMCDKIIFIEGGKVHFQGNYEEFKAQGFSYIKNNAEKEEIKEINHEENDKNEPSSTENAPVQDSCDDEVHKASVKFKVYYMFLKFGFKSIIVMLLFALMCIATQSLYIGMSYWNAYWSSRNSSEQKNWLYPVVLAIISLTVLVTTYIRNLCMLKAFYISARQIHNNSFSRTVLAHSKFLDKNSEGKLLNVFSRDTYSMDNNLITNFTDSIMYVLIIFSYFIAIIIVLPYDAIIIFAYGIYVYYLHRLIAHKIRILKRKDLTSRNPVYGLFSETIEGIEAIRCYGMKNIFKEKLTEKASIAARISFNFITCLRFYNLACSLGISFALGMSSLMIVLILSKDDATLASMSLSFTASIMSYVPLLIRTMTETEITMTNVERVSNFINVQPEGDTTSENWKIRKGSVEFAGVDMRYDDSLDFVLKNVNFQIEGGSKVGIVGRTGCGKSTIFQVLFRMYPISSGNIFIDGQDIYTIGLHNLRKQMSIIPQVPFIFTTTLRNNIDALNQYTDDDIKEALKAVKLYDHFQALNGLNTHLSPALSLSTGEKQLLCLARAIITKNKILITDEATAYVDQESDKFIQEIIREKFKSSTILAISHRLANLKDYDKIIVMDKGSVIKIGSPSEILTKQSPTDLLFPTNNRFSNQKKNSSFSLSSQMSYKSSCIARELSRSIRKYHTIRDAI